MPAPIVPAPMTAMACTKRGRDALEHRAPWPPRARRRTDGAARGLARPAQLLERRALARPAPRRMGRRAPSLHRCRSLPHERPGDPCRRAAPRLPRAPTSAASSVRDRPVAQARLAPTQAARVLHRGGAQVAFPRAHPEVQRRVLLTRHALAAAHKLDRARDADEARQALRAAGTGNDAQRDFGQADQRAGDSPRAHRIPAPVRSRHRARAVQRGDHRLRATLDGRDDRRQLRLLAAAGRTRAGPTPAMNVLPAPMITAASIAGVRG